MRIKFMSYQLEWFLCQFLNACFQIAGSAQNQGNAHPIPVKYVHLFCPLLTMKLEFVAILNLLRMDDKMGTA